jgi:hypothetical protein
METDPEIMTDDQLNNAQINLLEESLNKIREAIALGARRTTNIENKMTAQNEIFEKRIQNLESHQSLTTINESKMLKSLIKETINNESRENNLVITGIINKKNENLNNIFSSICKKIGLHINPMVSIKRFKGFNHPIIVKFFDRNDKTKFFNKYITIAKNLTLASIFNNESKQSRIWIQHDMDGTNYKIYKKALKMKKDQMIYSVKNNSGKIFIKVEKSSTEQPIHKLADLDEIMI